MNPPPRPAPPELAPGCCGAERPAVEHGRGEEAERRAFRKLNSKRELRWRLPVGPSAARDPPPWKPTMVTEFNFKAMDGGLPRRVRHICESGLRCRTVCLLTLVSLTSMPSL